MITDWEVIQFRQGGSCLSATVPGIRGMLGLGKYSVNIDLSRCAAGAPRTPRPTRYSLQGGQIPWLGRGAKLGLPVG